MPFTHFLGNRGLNSQQLLMVCLALVAMGGGAYFSVLLVEQHYQDNLEKSLTALLNATEEAIHIWKDEERDAVQGLASEEYIRDAAKALLAVQRKQKPLLAASAQQQLRRMMKPHLSHYRGYFLIAPDNISLASSRDSRVSISNGKHQVLLLRALMAKSLNAGLVMRSWLQA